MTAQDIREAIDTAFARSEWVKCDQTLPCGYDLQGWQHRGLVVDYWPPEAVHTGRDPARPWVVLHRESGKSLDCDFATEREARLFAFRAADLLDWSMDEDDLAKLVEPLKVLLAALYVDPYTQIPGVPWA